MQSLKILVLATGLYLAHSAQLLAQRVGIGSNTPRAMLDVQAADSNLLTLFNSNSLNADTRTSLLFRNGIYYTAGIKSIGTGSNSARLSFFTFADVDSNDVRERLSILDNGRVGIGITNPTSTLEVAGNGRFTATNISGGALVGTNTGASYLNSGLRGRADAVGIVGEGLSNIGVGVAGYNVGGASQPDFFAGSGVFGYSSVGHGVVGQSARVGYAGVFGTARANEAIGGLFISGESFSNTLALRTVGSIRLGGIGESAGRVLTSDGLGNATWQTPPAPAKAFSARLTNNEALSSNVIIDLGNMTEIFDQGNLFATGTNTFTAPEDGIYQVSFTATLNLVNVTQDFSTRSSFKVNGQSPTKNSLLNLRHHAIGTGTVAASHHNARLLQLSAGDVVGVDFAATFSAGNINIQGGNFGNTTVLSVHQVK